jgi:hypothetical protein
MAEPFSQTRSAGFGGHAEPLPGASSNLSLMQKFGVRGPALQAAMFEAGEYPDPVEVDTLAAAARDWFAGR